MKKIREVIDHYAPIKKEDSWIQFKSIRTMKFPVHMGHCGNIFHVGTIKNPKNFDSHVWRDKWTVNCINHWVASLGHNLNVKNAIHNHLVIVLHELTHAKSGILHGDKNDKTLGIHDWDDFLDELLNEVKRVE